MAGVQSQVHALPVEVEAWYEEHVCRPGRASAKSSVWWQELLDSDGWGQGWPPGSENLGISPFEEASAEVADSNAAIPRNRAPMHYVAGSLSPFFIERAYRLGSTKGQCVWCIYFGPYTSNGAATPAGAVAQGGAISAAFDLFTAQVASLAGYPQCVHAALNVRMRRPCGPIPGAFRIDGSILGIRGNRISIRAELSDGAGNLLDVADATLVEMSGKLRKSTEIILDPSVTLPTTAATSNQQLAPVASPSSLPVPPAPPAPSSADSREGRWQQTQTVAGAPAEPPVQKSELMSRLLGGMRKKSSL
jgi:hypothetical protein